MSQTELILLTLYELSKRENPVSYEKLVVTTFEKYPDIFGLKEYPQYPDSFSINRRIYLDLKKLGYCQFKKKKVYISSYGKEVAEQLKINLLTKTNKNKKNLTNMEKKQYEYLLNLKGFNLFIDDSNIRILDIDAYEFYSITVRTPKKEIARKKMITKSIISKAKNNSLTMVDKLIEYKSKIDKVLEGLINEYNTATN
ncbi:MAG: hypothetical protein H8E55_47555 [Pelagibacterales bacterium]|nr:hypothetical protein [Pelagibacterales bacterium]